MSADNKGLGIGLNALLSRNSISHPEEISKSIQTNTSLPAESSLQKLNCDQLQRGRYQPRRDMDSDKLNELSISIKKQGIIEPIVVRQIGPHSYEILAGERRWQAAKLAGFENVPCIIKNISDREAMTISLIENIQREDLNPMEESEGLLALKKGLSLTDELLASAVGKSRSTITNMLRLNELEDKVKDLLRMGEIEMGHARTLLSLPIEQQKEAALLVVQKGLTVRETEKLVKSLLNPKQSKDKKDDPDFDFFANEVKEKFAGMSVKCVQNGHNRGKLILSYKNYDELEKIKKIFGF